MIYRVTEMNSMTGRYEDYEITDVIGFTNWLIETYPHLADKIMPFPLLYHGPAKDIYPELSLTLLELSQQLISENNINNLEVDEFQKLVNETIKNEKELD